MCNITEFLQLWEIHLEFPHFGVLKIIAGFSITEHLYLILLPLGPLSLTKHVVVTLLDFSKINYVPFTLDGFNLDKLRHKWT